MEKLVKICLLIFLVVSAVVLLFYIVPIVKQQVADSNNVMATIQIAMESGNYKYNNSTNIAEVIVNNRTYAFYTFRHNDSSANVSESRDVDTSWVGPANQFAVDAFTDGI